jgi:galactokinase
MKASEWLQRLAARTDPARKIFERLYGTDNQIISVRIALVRKVLSEFIDRFGDREVGVFRSPGRINLRGMHVDTHGGYLNLMTHHRETVIVVAPSHDSSVRLFNVEPAFPASVFDLRESRDSTAFHKPWTEFIGADEIRRDVLSRPGHWENYLRGCSLRLKHGRAGEVQRGMVGVAGSDLPRGAALSSSAALCVAFTLALAAENGIELTARETILTARDGEWFAGTRCGTSDQAAMVMGKPGAILNVALHGEAEPISPPRFVELPDHVRVVIIDSMTERALSGRERVTYTRNRFAYSMALNVARQELRRIGIPDDEVERTRTLLDFSRYDRNVVFTMLKAVPVEATLTEIKMRYELPDFERAYAHNFELAAPEDRPESIRLRGPLVYGIAESERARIFSECIECDDVRRAGELMYIGHDGDRLNGNYYSRFGGDVSDESIEAFSRGDLAICDLPGVYRASSLALDALVDKARNLGALGASLTGAGIAGSVLALVEQDHVSDFVGGIESYVRGSEYARLAGIEAPVDDAREMAVVNSAVSGAGEIWI